MIHIVLQRNEKTMSERRAWSRESERGGSHKIHGRQPRWYSPSPEERYYGGNGVEAGCHHMGG